MHLLDRFRRSRGLVLRDMLASLPKMGSISVMANIEDSGEVSSNGTMRDAVSVV